MARRKTTSDAPADEALKATPAGDEVRIRTEHRAGTCPTCGAPHEVRRAELASGDIVDTRTTLRAVPRPPDPDAPALTATDAEARTEVVPIDGGKPAKGKLTAVSRRAPEQAQKRDNGRIRTAEIDGSTVEIREAREDGRRPIDGLAVPYGRASVGPVMPYNAREQFAAGAFGRFIRERGDRPVPILDRHDGNVVGSAVLEDTPEGVRYQGALLRSMGDSTLAEQIADGLVRPSIEFMPTQSPARRSRDLVEHADGGLIQAIAFTYRPAYGETTAQIRHQEGSPMNCPRCGLALEPGIAHVCPTPDDAAAGSGALPLTREQLDPLIREAVDESIRRNAGFGRPIQDDELAIYNPHGRSLGSLITAAVQEGASRELRSFVARALDDVVSTSGANAGMFTANTFGDIRRLVTSTRPSITAFGGPADLPGDGLSIGYPYYDGTLTDLVGAQSAEKAEITSGPVDIKRGTVTIATYAGGNDISYQLIRRATGSYLEAYGRIMLAAWALVTNTAFVTALEAGSVTGDFTEALASVDATELKNLFVDASVAVQAATGSPAEFVLAGTNAFKAAAKLMPWQLTGSATGQADARGLNVNVSGLPVIHDPAITTAKFIVSNRESARWLEDGPFVASAEDVAKLGRNVAYWSLGAPAIYVPAGVIEVYDVTP